MARKLRAFDRRGFVAAYDFAKTGLEPTWENAEEWDILKFQTERARSLNFYNYYLKKKEMYQFLFDWMKDNGYSTKDIAAAKIAPHIKQTPCKIARCLTMGMPNRQKELQKLYNKKDNGFCGEAINDVEYVTETVENAIALGRVALKQKKELEQAEELSDEDKTFLQNSQEKKDHENFVCNVMLPLEQMIDKWSDSKIKTPSKMSISGMLTEIKNKPEFFIEVDKWFTSMIEEYEMVLSKTDNEYCEGYSFLKPKKVRIMVKLLKEMQEEISDFVNKKTRSKATKKKIRKVRQKKVKSPAVIVKKVKYCEEHEELKSFAPVDVLGKHAVITFNHKNNKLSMYRSEDKDGFTFKGTSLKGFKEDDSLCVRIKPNMIDNIIKRRTYETMKKNLPNRVPKTPSGRFDENTLILKII